ncbi:MAG TPA: hypothetical protein VEZ89_12415 [Rubrivivax sp.]|nr:hypothetical protein [Rubrivivax sp.]
MFDHCYQKVTRLSDYERFESLGFTLLAGSAEHPYSLLSRILFFGSPEVSVNGAIHCLEFCWIRDVEGELAYAKKSNPSAQERDLFMPGFSLRSPTSLEATFELQKARWSAFRPSLSHRNYDWTEGGEGRRAGWNFLDFETPVVPGVVVWATEYEASPAREGKRLERLAMPSHRNGVNAILGFVFDVSDQEKAALSILTGAQWLEGVLTLQDGPKIFNQRERPEFAGLLETKTSPFKAVILGCASLSRFSEVSGLFPLEHRSIVQITAPQPESWDILVAEPSVVD